MVMRIEPSTKVDVERTALYQTLSKLLDSPTFENVLSFFESKHLISMTDPYPISRRQIEDALYQYFREGAVVLMREYDIKFLELMGKKDTVA